MYERILIATDGHDLSKKAVKTGIALAVSLDAEVIAFKSVPRYPMNYFEGGVVLSPDEIKRIEKDWLQNAQLVVDAVQQSALKSGVKARAILGRGEPSESIISAAKKHKCGLIVMASHGRKGVKRILLGSETLAVLTHSDIPVLVLR
jgi:nucleotide-binding universal stress UspA family protein